MLDRHDWYEFLFNLWVLSYPQEGRWWRKQLATSKRRLKRWAIKRAAKE